MVFFFISEFSFFKRKHVFVSHENEEIETLIHESQHADENSERHEVEMLTSLSDKNKITTCESMNSFIITFQVITGRLQKYVSLFKF